MLCSSRLRWLLSLSVVLLLAACTTVPVTGRRSLSLVSDGDLTRMSLDSYVKVINESTLSEDPEHIEQVWRVGNRLATATETYLRARGYETRNFDWEYNVIEDESANAWAMPGGKIAVYTGIFPITQDDAGLAVVLSHEIAHVLAGHANERVSQGMLTQLGSAAIGAAVNDSSGVTQRIILQSYGIGSQVGILLPYSRLHETEADRIGLTLMAQAGYDPREAIGLWERMDAKGGSRPPKFLSTHPVPQDRIAKIRSYLPEALKVYYGTK